MGSYTGRNNSYVLLVQCYRSVDRTKISGGDSMKINCESCAHYEYDEEYECYTCQMHLDEDELYMFVTGTNHD